MVHVAHKVIFESEKKLVDELYNKSRHTRTEKNIDSYNKAKQWLEQRYNISYEPPKEKQR